MTDRRYLSGAQKRKMSEGKKKKDDDLMKSIPKLFDMGFSISRKSAESGESLAMAMESGRMKVRMSMLMKWKSN